MGTNLKKGFCGGTLDVEKHTNKEKRTFKSVSLGAREKLWVIYFWKESCLFICFSYRGRSPKAQHLFPYFWKAPNDYGHTQVDFIMF